MELPWLLLVDNNDSMDSVNDCEPFSLESLLHPDVYRSFFDNSILEQVLEPSTSLVDLPIPPSIDFPERSSQPQNSDRYSDSAAVEPSPILDDAELEKFIDQQKNCNTKRKTESDLHCWYSWCRSVGKT